MKLFTLLFVSFIMQSNFAMLTVTQSDKNFPPLTLTIDTVGAVQDVIDLYKETKNSALEGFCNIFSEERKSLNITLGKSLCEKKGRPAAAITDNEAFDAFKSDLTLQMLEKLKRNDPNGYIHMLMYFHTKTKERTERNLIDYALSLLKAEATTLIANNSNFKK